MKKLIFPFIAIVAIVAGMGCSTKFKIAAPYKNITVIYGYLDMNDTAHYIRVQKAFLDQSKSALTMAQTPDSSFYANINVRINRIDLNDSLVHDTIHLNRVDLGQEGYPKQQGVFFNTPNYAYKFKNLLDPNYIYRIVVTNQSTGQVDSSDAPVIDDRPNDINPASGTPYFTSPVFSDTSRLGFASTLPNKYVDIFAVYTPPSNFNFEGISTPAVVAQLIIQFNWDDSDFTTHLKTPRSSDYDLGYQYLLTSTGTGQIDYQIPDVSLYIALSSALGLAPANVIRLLDVCNVYIYLGTQDFLSYQQNSLVQGTGLTGSEIEPVYTNVKGPDALGLYTSRGMQQGTMKYTFDTVDSLEISPLMQGTNIQGTVYY
jgi:hypothetical protein